MKYQQITQEERYTISKCKQNGMSITETATFIGRHRSTVDRELKRNHNPCGGYNPKQAQERTNARRRNSRKKSQFSAEQWSLIDKSIRLDWSPEQTALVFTSLNVVSICTETIYTHIYNDKKNGGNLYTHLRHAAKQRRKRYNSNDSRGILAGKRSLSERPSGAQRRSRKGHFEIDLVHGYEHTDCILTLVDRKTRFLIILKLPNKTNAVVEKALIPIIKKFNIKTISADNGTEWHGYNDIEAKTGCNFFFAEPYHSWERGTNENTNGLIRQYLPKRKSMHRLNQMECELIAQKLNRRPRKILNLSCPETCHLGIPFLSHF